MSEAADRVIGSVTVLYGDRGGKYPDGNSLWVRGAEESLLIDPSLGVVARADGRPEIDRVLNSHCHEDHIAGNHLYPDVPWLFHEADLPGIRSLDDMMRIYGYPAAIEREFRKIVEERFHFSPRTDATPFRDGDVFDLGGGTRVRVIHAPGHTRGHCLFHIEPDDVLYLGDIDLSSFGPYYGDAWSDLADFERSLDVARKFEARHYATFHHIGVIDDRAAYLDRLGRYEAVIASREARLLEFLAQPHTLEEIADHRFVYRPQDPIPFAWAVEARSMGQHVERLQAAGRVTEVEAGRYRAA